MEKQILLASDFKSRLDLENYIKAEVSVDISKNREAENTIEGTREQLKKLRLDDQKSVFGFRVVINDGSSTKELLEKKLKR